MAINEKEIYDYILENIIQIENDLKRGWKWRVV